MKKIAVLLGFAGLISFHFSQAQESESVFKAKLAEDISGYADGIKSACGTTLKMTWVDKKALGKNPRETFVTTLVTSALDGIQYLCTNNEGFKSKIAKIKSLEFKRGKGAISGRVKGTNIEITIDEEFSSKNASEQEEVFKVSLLSQLDK